MTFTEAVSTCFFKKYLDFNGRAGRREYWFWALFTFLVLLVWSIIVTIMPDALSKVAYIVYCLIDLAFIIPSIAVAVRRLHDIGKSGAWIFISLIPLVGSIIMLIFLLSDSHPGTNKYGPNPKEYVSFT